MEEKENNNQENQEEISQEDLAKAWAEMLEQEPVVEEKEEKKKKLRLPNLKKTWQLHGHRCLSLKRRKRKKI